MAAPANPVGTMPTLTSGAADSGYNINLATIEHGENNLFGPNYGTTGEIGGTLGEGILNTNQGMEAQVGPNYAKTGELGGSLGRGQGERTRGLSARAGANTQSGLYGTERGNVLRGFGERAAGVERVGHARIKDIETKARTAWEQDQFDRANAILAANTRYTNNVARNPTSLPPPGAPPIAAGFLPQSESTVPGGGYPAGNTTNVRVGPARLPLVPKAKTNKTRIGPGTVLKSQRETQ